MFLRDAAVRLVLPNPVKQQSILFSSFIVSSTNTVQKTIVYCEAKLRHAQYNADVKRERNFLVCVFNYHMFQLFDSVVR